ncbi:MAG: GNAT family N-acetyltransferase [Chloroflexi bacterium]|nr:MAG: GNAT family N-acetyltransferase [Chloroflexota bacterium]TME45875.1 MAG: GNAT family N-acetyltransferase [Chloroflexota bacterium]
MSVQVRPAQLKDLGAIEGLYRQQLREAERPALKKQFASSRLWFLLNHAFASILPIASPADHVYVMQDSRRKSIQGFVQAETASLGPGAWQILNLCLSPDLERFGGGTALLDHLFNEGLKRGVTKFVVRVPVDDPIADLFKARGFTAYATEHALLAENVASRAAAPLAGWRAMRREDELGLYLLYCASTPKAVAAVEAANFSEWRRTFGLGARAGRLPRRAGQPRFVVERVQVVGWMSLSPGAGGRPHTLGLLAAAQPPDLWPSLVQRALAYVAQHQPGPVWCSLRHYDPVGIRLLQREGFEVIASQTLLVRELPMKVPAKIRVRIKDKRLVPQYG